MGHAHVDQALKSFISKLRAERFLGQGSIHSKAVLLISHM